MVIFGWFLILLMFMLLPPPSLPPLRMGRLGCKRRDETSLRYGRVSGNRTRAVSEHRDVWVMPNLSMRRTWFAEGDDDLIKLEDLDLSSVDPTIKSFIEQQQAYVKKINHESASRRIELDQLKTQVEGLTEAQRKKLEDEGKYKDLYQQQSATLTDLQLKAERAEALEAQIKASNDAVIAQIPEHRRHLVPDLPPEKLAVYLGRALPDLTAPPPTPPNLNAGDSTDGTKPVELTPEQEEQYQRGDFESRQQYVELLNRYKKQV